MSLRAIAIPAQNQQPSTLLVALHGWGANADDLASLASYLDHPGYQMIFPDAPFPHPYSPAGRMWYSLPDDYSFFSQDAFRQQPELVESRQLLTEWLMTLEATTGIPLHRTILAGFSQGGAMTLDVGLSLPVGALMVLSGYFHAPPLVQSSPIPPILMVHGWRDQVVSVEAARRAKNALLELGATVQYHELDMGHEIPFTVLGIMQSFMGEQAIALGETTTEG